MIAVAVVGALCFAAILLADSATDWTLPHPIRFVVGFVHASAFAGII